MFFIDLKTKDKIESVEFGTEADFNIKAPRTNAWRCFEIYSANLTSSSQDFSIFVRSIGT